MSIQVRQIESGRGNFRTAVQHLALPHSGYRGGRVEDELVAEWRERLYHTILAHPELIRHAAGAAALLTPHIDTLFGVRVGIRKTDPSGRLTYLDSVADLKSGRKALRIHANRAHFDVNDKKECYGKMADEIPRWEEEIEEACQVLGGMSRVLLTSEHRRLVGSTWPTAGARTLMQTAVLFYETELTADVDRWRQLFPQGGGAVALDLPDEWVRWLALSWGNYTIKMCGEINDENRLMHEVAYALYRKASRSMTYQQALEAASDILTTGDAR